MPYRYIDSIAIADAAFEVWDASIKEIFKSASEALLGIMLNNREVLSAELVKTINIEAETYDMLLFRMLNEIIYLKDAESSFYIVSDTVLKRKGNLLTLEAVLSGEKIDTSKHNTIVDVKAVTMHELSVVKKDDIWRAFVVVDV